MIVGYAGAQAGFTANLMIAGTDSLLQALRTKPLMRFSVHLGNLLLMSPVLVLHDCFYLPVLPCDWPCFN